MSPQSIYWLLLMDHFSFHLVIQLKQDLRFLYIPWKRNCTSLSISKQCRSYWRFRREATESFAWYFIHTQLQKMLSAACLQVISLWPQLQEHQAPATPSFTFLENCPLPLSQIWQVRSLLAFVSKLVNHSHLSLLLSHLPETSLEGYK